MSDLLSKFSFAEELQSYSARDKRITELCTQLKEVIGIDVMPDFNYKEGKFIGLIKLMSRSFKHRQKLATTFNVSERIFTLFNDSFGTPSYVDKNGVLVDAVPMNIERTVEILQYLEELWEVTQIENAYADFNQKHIDKVYANALTYAKDQLLVGTNAVTYAE